MLKISKYTAHLACSLHRHRLILLYHIVSPQILIETTILLPFCSPESCSRLAVAPVQARGVFVAGTCQTCAVTDAVGTHPYSRTNNNQNSGDTRWHRARCWSTQFTISIHYTVIIYDHQSLVFCRVGLTSFPLPVYYLTAYSILGVLHSLLCNSMCCRMSSVFVRSIKTQD